MSDNQAIHYSLVFPDGSYFRVPSKRVTVGREMDCGLVIEDPLVSRHHAEIFLRGSTLYIVDLGSANGTFLNGHRLTVERPIAGGDILELGDTRI